MSRAAIVRWPGLYSAVIEMIRDVRAGKLTRHQQGDKMQQLRRDYGCQAVADVVTTVTTSIMEQIP